MMSPLGKKFFLLVHTDVFKYGKGEYHYMCYHLRYEPLEYLRGLVMGLEKKIVNQSFSIQMPQTELEIQTAKPMLIFDEPSLNIWLNHHTKMINLRGLPFAQEHASLQKIDDFFSAKKISLDLEDISYNSVFIRGLLIAKLNNNPRLEEHIQSWEKVLYFDYDLAYLDNIKRLFANYSRADLLKDYKKIYKKEVDAYRKHIFSNQKNIAQSAEDNLNAPAITHIIGFDSAGEPEVKIFGDDTIEILFNFMPPLNQKEDQVDNIYWDNFATLLSKELKVKVEREDRESFLILNPKSSTARKVIKWLETFWAKHPDAPR